MTSSAVNLVNMDISEEVNNNNAEDKPSCPPEQVDVEESPRKAEEDLEQIYSLNDTFRIKVTSAEEWLCVARMPRDFTQTEFQELLEEFGPIQQCFLIHSEISGWLLFYNFQGLLRISFKANKRSLFCM